MAKTLEQLLAQQRPHTYFVCRPIIPSGGIVVILGQEKAMKSLLATNLAYLLASGRDVWRWPIRGGARSVLYIEQEVGEWELQERLEKMHSYWNDPIAKLNLRLVSKDLRIGLDTAAGIKRLTEEVEEANPDVLILDPIREFHSGDENDSTSMMKVMRPARQLCIDRRMTLVIIHHTAKASEFRPGNTPSSGRGSNYLVTSANTIMNLEKLVKTDESVVKVSFVLRSDRTPRPLTLRLNEQLVFEEVT